VPRSVLVTKSWGALSQGVRSLFAIPHQIPASPIDVCRELEKLYVVFNGKWLSQSHKRFGAHALLQKIDMEYSNRIVTLPRRIFAACWLDQKFTKRQLIINNTNLQRCRFVTSSPKQARATRWQSSSMVCHNHRCLGFCPCFQ
jgi:hypothetical protein